MGRRRTGAHEPKPRMMPHQFFALELIRFILSLSPHLTLQDKIRPLWRHYYQNTQGLIFVVDSNDRDRIDAGLLCPTSSHLSQIA